MTVIFGAAAGAAFTALCVVGAAAETIDQIYEAAKAEKTLVLWGAGPSAGYETAARAFEQQYPGVTVTLMGGFSNVLNAKIEEQFSAKKVETDLLVFQTVQDFVRWNKRGLLMHFKPEGFETIGAGAKDKDGAWIAVNANPLFYGYNTELVTPDDVPKSALDFLKPQFKGKLISAFPADDDATLYDFHTVVRKYGWGYMDRYMAQQPKFIQGHLGVARSLGSSGSEFKKGVKGLEDEVSLSDTTASHAAPQVTGVVVNGGAAQRSRVMSVTVASTAPATFVVTSARLAPVVPVGAGSEPSRLVTVKTWSGSRFLPTGSV